MTSILIVDDEEMIREELREALELEDFAVTDAPSGSEALEICSENAFDVIVTDLKMPGMCGLQLLQEIKEREISAKLIVVSGHGAKSNEVEAVALGAKVCLSKPLNVDVLVDNIRGT